ncbi:MAG: hypothetical protein AAFV26_08825, partial [Pseudomonadota bacterium]
MLKFALPAALALPMAVSWSGIVALSEAPDVVPETHLVRVALSEHAGRGSDLQPGDRLLGEMRAWVSAAQARAIPSQQSLKEKAAPIRLAQAAETDDGEPAPDARERSPIRDYVDPALRRLQRAGDNYRREIVPRLSAGGGYDSIGADGNARARPADDDVDRGPGSGIRERFDSVFEDVSSFLTRALRGYQGEIVPRLSGGLPSTVITDRERQRADDEETAGTNTDEADAARRRAEARRLELERQARLEANQRIREQREAERRRADAEERAREQRQQAEARARAEASERERALARERQSVGEADQERALADARAAAERERVRLRAEAERQEAQRLAAEQRLAAARDRGETEAAERARREAEARRDAARRRLEEARAEQERLRRQLAQSQAQDRARERQAAADRERARAEAERR